MALLIVHIPRRLAWGAESPTPAGGGREWSFVWSDDGLSASRDGVATLDALPSADRTVWVLDETDVTWLKADLPKGPGHRLPELLAGLLEDQIAGDVADTHLAVGSSPAPGEARWVACLHRPWLRSLLEAWRTAGREVDAVVCGTEPTSVLRCHRRLSADGVAEVVVSGPAGVVVTDSHGVWLRSLDASQAAWTTEPDAAGLLADAGPRLTALLNRRDRLVAAATQGSNLLQFDLAARNRSTRWAHALKDALTLPEARWLRRGAFVLAGIQLVGLCAGVWQQERRIQAIEARSVSLLRSTFPQLTLILEPTRQMQREVQALEARAGVPPATDLDAWLDIAAAHWPEAHPPLTRVQGDVAMIRLEATPWPEAALKALGEHAAAQGWSVTLSGSQWSAQPGRSGGRP